jgi:hypothetical protein
MVTWVSSNLASVLVATTERKQFLWSNRVAESLVPTSADISLVNTATVQNYNDKMVREILKGRTLLPEATFDSDSDLVDWLNQP